jgi:hypothetical protein
MTADQLRAVRNANPFRPFKIHLADGRALPVRHRDYVSQSPGGRTVIIYESEEAFNLVDLLLVSAIEAEETAGSM